MVIQKELQEIEALLEHYDKKNESVSSGGMDWHLDHTLRVIVGICSALKKSNPKDYKWEFKIARLYVMTLGNIPRGRGRAPKVAVAKDPLSKSVIQSLLEKSKKSLVEIESLAPKNFFDHPYFGKMKLSAAKKFLQIHTEHHLKIMREIVG